MSLNNKKEYRLNYGGKEVVIETGRMAKQADGAVLVTCGGTQVLVAVCSARELKDGQDFFPLLVEYQEKFFAAGKFLGGFIKREARPSTKEILASRLIDRPLRPMFPSDYMFDTVVTCTILSFDDAGDPEVLAGLGASAALAISDIPFVAPIGACKVGRFNGEVKLNPNWSEWSQSPDFEIAVAASKEAILMVEGEANVVPEKDILDAILLAHAEIKKYCELVEKMQKEVGRPKRTYVSAEVNSKLIEEVKKQFQADGRAVLSINDKMQRQDATRALNKKVEAALSQNFAQFGLTEDASFGKLAGKAVEELLYVMMRNDILTEGKRIGGRKLNEVRPIETEVSVLKVPHGSALFTRGETQVLATATLGNSLGDQMADRIMGISYDKFYLHYNFPGFSVGEAKGSRGAGRRELGHGNLAERALKAAMPKEFPYTVRIVCDVLESNGSSSMGSVCSGSMALLDAGVPLAGQVAGVAMGLVTDGKGNFKILTDILGDEDFLGDMDFKVAGTKDGMTAIQMDIKITGITPEIMKTAIEDAYKGRMHILNEMNKTISTNREEYKQGVPRMVTLQIPQDKIGALIGPGGKNIKKVQEDFKTILEIAEDGTVKVMGQSKEDIERCATFVNLQINGPEIGSVYGATVVTIKEYGAFVDLVPGISGLVHVSEISDERVGDVNEFVKEGDIIQVKVVEIDKMGRLKLSAKAVAPLKKRV